MSEKREELTGKPEDWIWIDGQQLIDASKPEAGGPQPVAPTKTEASLSMLMKLLKNQVEIGSIEWR